MSELVEDEEDKTLIAEDEFDEAAEEIIIDNRQRSTSDARRRLENMLEEKRLRDELEDFLDY